MEIEEKEMLMEKATEELFEGDIKKIAKYLKQLKNDFSYRKNVKGDRILQIDVENIERIINHAKELLY
ncbi:hypothetical protein KO361_04420 [Candidatus Woesearchaeota archaeon]|jgi:cytochrome c553|nr:hypothetical protein [Candidatus Woesearchaeota archaeon]